MSGLRAPAEGPGCQDRVTTNSPVGIPRLLVREKLAQRAIKRQFLAIVSTQSELFHARTHIRPSRATNIAHSTQKHGDVETNNTTARPPNKGPLKPASPLLPENAPKTPISHPQRRWRFQPHTDTREQRRQWFQTTGPPRLQGPAAPPTLTKPGHAWVVPCLHGCQTTHRVPLRQRRP